ncbi:4-hydroxyphenylpyruvate dioxygenase [Glycocaulis albus]|jgi:4-hydroxyphenylpyruvate dioxygenase|uniref:4-hydroxyphenylpyruvate dioxygenase n=1 Tax=Glycocaulis albus TaxID=1382801 RepID=A0ABQ1XMZ9_9PROT|nr:4-hydroxyphenylpyruvate dioxygenase [Glycocaulis albus]GGG98083.1 4-hydroxyphenylpyruvate dioxygenase [Glycocaulis albus]
MADLFENPLGTDGFEFVEYTSPEPEKLDKLFRLLGFTAVAKHKTRDIVRYKQGDITFLVNREKTGQAADFRAEHGPSANAMAFRVRDAKQAYKDAIARGAEPYGTPLWGDDQNLPAIKGIGGSVLYLVDQYGASTIYDETFEPIPGAEDKGGAGLETLDHLTHNVFMGRMNHWASFYENVFNFREIRYFDIKGAHTGLLSRAMTGPCGKLRIPLNESSDDKSQIAEYLREYNGEGIQHIALTTSDIYSTVEQLRANGVEFQSTPPTYYELVDERVPGHGEDLERLKKNSILVDGDPESGQGLLLQIFTTTNIGPIFFEIIQRKGNEGFGEGNFKALFESIELDQIRRGVLKPDAAE